MGTHLLPPLFKLVVEPIYGEPVTIRFIPDAHPEVSSVDGSVGRLVSPYTWASKHDDAGSIAYPSTNYKYSFIQSRTYSDNWQIIWRCITLFDTSSIPSNAKIISAGWKPRLYFKQDGLSCLPQFCVVSSNPATNTDLIPADYQALGTTPLSDIVDLADIPGTGTYTFTLNSAGLAAIAKGGITKLGIREYKYDVLNVEPTWVYDDWSGVQWYSAEGGFLATNGLFVTYQPQI